MKIYITPKKVNGKTKNNLSIWYEVNLEAGKPKTKRRSKKK